MARYRAIDPGSLSREVIARHYRQRGLKSPERFALDRLCAGGGERSARTDGKSSKRRPAEEGEGGST